MVKIINPVSGGGNPIAEVLSGLGRQMWGDTGASALRNEQILAQQIKNVETQNLMHMIANNGGAQALGSNPVTQALLVGSGYNPGQFADMGLMGAATQYGARDQRTQDWQVGAGEPYTSTAGAFDATLAEQQRNNNLQSGDRRYGVDQDVLQRQWLFNNTPQAVNNIDPVTGLAIPGFTPQGILAGTMPSTPGAPPAGGLIPVPGPYGPGVVIDTTTTPPALRITPPGGATAPPVTPPVALTPTGAGPDVSPVGPGISLVVSPPRPQPILPRAEVEGNILSDVYRRGGLSDLDQRAGGAPTQSQYNADLARRRAEAGLMSPLEQNTMLGAAPTNEQNRAAVYNANPPPPGSLAASTYTGEAPSTDIVKADTLLSMLPTLSEFNQQVVVGANPGVDDLQAQLFAENQGNLAGMDPFMQRFLKIEPPTPPAPGTTWNARSPDGRTVATNDVMAARGLGVDGVTPLPPDWMRVNAEMTGDPSAFTPAVRTDLQSDDIAYQKWDALTNRALPLTDDPALFGMGGFLRSKAQDILQGAGGLPLVGARFAATLVDAAGAPLGPEAAKELIPEFYDPRLSEVEALWGLLIYQGAAVLTGQQGRSVSDADVRYMRTILGNPQSFFASNLSMRSKLQVAMDVVNDYAGITRNALGQGGVQTPAAPAATPSPAAPAPAAPGSGGRPPPGEPVKVINPAGQEETIREIQPGYWQRLRPDGMWEPMN